MANLRFERAGWNRLAIYRGQGRAHNLGYIFMRSGDIGLNVVRLTLEEMAQIIQCSERAHQKAADRIT